MPFLPITKEEMLDRGWDCADVVLVTGDAYVDHPSFGIAILSRVLEACGWRVCILPQPRSAADFTRFGRPTLGFFISGGNIDSMVAHYTAAKKKRSDDAYTAGGKAGARPDRASTAGRRGRPIPTAPLSSAGWRPLCAGSPITTIGTTGCGPPSCWTAGRICSPSAWGRGRPWKSPAASPRGSR